MSSTLVTENTRLGEGAGAADIFGSVIGIAGGLATQIIQKSAAKNELRYMGQVQGVNLEQSGLTSRVQSQVSGSVWKMAIPFIAIFGIAAIIVVGGK